MEKTTYKILRKNIPNVSLVSTTSQSWYDYDGQIVSWSGLTYFGPETNDVVYNLTTGGTLSLGYYKWNGSVWTPISESQAFDDFNIPLYLNTTLDEMGGMVQFDGDLEQIEQVVNFTYTQTGNTIQVYGTTNPNKLREILEQTFTINWGDGTSTSLSVNSGIIGDTLPSVSKTYAISSGYTITISLDAPWVNQKLSKSITIPKWNMVVSNPLGTFTGVTVPAYSNLTGQTQNYIYDFDYQSGYTGYTTFRYLSLGRSRISEKKQYGVNTYTGVTYGSDTIGSFSGYTIDNLDYRDYDTGYTLITGATSGFTKEEVFNTVLTRNEHFLGFIEDPIIYSDIFVERGKQNVMENNLRLGEIDSTGEIDIYGNGYFTIRKQ